MKYIKLTQNKYAKVDDKDYEWLNQFKWCAHRQGAKWYAKKHIKTAKSKHSTIGMHRFIMDTPAGKQVDHVDGDGMNNQRSNLRIATNAENSRNRGKQKNNTTGYKGVFRNSKYPDMFEAKIGVDGKHIYIGLFRTAELAHEAYVDAAKKYHGNFACV